MLLALAGAKNTVEVSVWNLRNGKYTENNLISTLTLHISKSTEAISTKQVALESEFAVESVTCKEGCEACMIDGVEVLLHKVLKISKSEIASAWLEKMMMIIYIRTSIPKKICPK